MEIKKNLSDLINVVKQEGLLKAYRLLKIKISRHNGPKELKKISKIDGFFQPVIIQYKNKKTEIKPIENEEKNLFVFWWDGFDSLPPISQACFDRLKGLYGEKFQIITLDKNNYKDYVRLDPIVEERFIKKQISIQTFSDILRVQLLRQNGGYWIDATVFLSPEYPFFKQLEVSSVDAFYAKGKEEKTFLLYKGKENPCISFFLGGRKDSVLFSFVYDCFLYYLGKKKSLPPYFLLDMLFILAMVYDIDDGALNKIEHHDVDIYYIQRNGEQKKSEDLSYYLSYPQKLNWRSPLIEDSLLDQVFKTTEVKR